MGRRGTKSKISTQKKKHQSPQSVVKSSASIPIKNPSKQGPRKSKSDELSKILRVSLKDLTETLASRLAFSYRESSPGYSSVTLAAVQEPSEKIDSILSSLVMELIEDILGQVPKAPDLCIFLQEALECTTAAGELLSHFCSEDSARHMCRLSFFYKILKPAWDVKKGLSKNHSVKTMFKEQSSFAKNFKDFSVLPLENLVQLINGNNSSKVFARVCMNDSTEGSISPDFSVDSEVEEFQLRLERCEKVCIRMKPLVSQEWINLLRRQIRENLELSN
jgi:hypothetical protein